MSEMQSKPPRRKREKQTTSIRKLKSSQATRPPLNSPLVTAPSSSILEPLKKKLDEGQTAKFVTLIRAEKWWIEQARINPAVFIEYVTGFTLGLHHRMWIANLFHPDRNRLNIIAPRESGKSTIINYAMAWLIGAQPLSNNVIVSVGSEQASARLRMIKSTIRDNIRYHNVFPDVFIDNRNGVPDTQQQFTVWSNRNNTPYSAWRLMVEKHGSPKDATLYCSGRGGRGILGARISGLMILDDIIDENDTNDAAQEKVMTYIIQTLIPCVKESGRVVNIGTRWMLGDIPERLRANPRWHTLEIQALRKSEVTGELQSYWPTQWPVYMLLAKKEEMQNDALFNVMYMNDPTALVGSLFNLEALSRGLPSPLPHLKSVWITTDQAISLKNRSDFNVYQLIGIDNANNYYLLDMERFKADPNGQVARLTDFYSRAIQLYGVVDGVLMENVGMQAFLQDILLKERPDLPIISHTPRGDKHHRASAVSKYSIAGKLYINQTLPDINSLKSEWLNFPLHKHDDTLDPISLLIQYLGQTVSMVSVKEVKSVHFL